MIRIARLSSLRGRHNGLAAAFLVGLAGGFAIGLAVQSRPAPAAPEVVNAAGENADSANAPQPPLPEVRMAIPRSVTSNPAAAIPADVLRVIDGDTFEARVHVWPGLEVTTKVRLRGIDAAELRARCPAERVKAEAARDALRDLLAEGAVGVYGVSIDKYGGRVVANAATRSAANVSAEMLNRGYARPYAGGHRDGWFDERP
jgi:endonuclease YncB( thermonuclease family)